MNLSEFKLLGDRKSFQIFLGSLEDARAFCQEFFTWYNNDHHHSGIGLMTPQVVHYGLAQKVFRAREKVLLAAYERNPERFVRKIPVPLALPQAAWINPPKSAMENESLLH